MKSIAGGFISIDYINDLYVEKLQSSGLTLTNAQDLGFNVLNDSEVFEILKQPTWRLPAIEIPYFQFDGVTPLRANKLYPQYKRYRRLLEVANSPDAPKYMAPNESEIFAYIPPLTNWKTIIDDPNQEIILTEGELKAAKACIEGFPAIAFAGVYGFRSAKLGIQFPRELERVNWVKRKVLLIFDSDIKTNDNVLNALMDLAYLLMDRGATPKVLILASIKDKKVGLDDFLVAEGAQKLRYLIDKTSEYLTLIDDLWVMNSKFAVIKYSDFVVVLETGDIIDRLTLIGSLTRDTFERVLEKGGISYKKVNVAKAWLDWPLRKEIEKVVYEPGQEALSIIELNGKHVYNMWPGWGCEPVEGDVTLFLELVEWLFKDAEPGVMDYFLNWLAFPLQHPGVKMSTCFLLVGIAQGTGKSSIGYTMEYIYGKNFTEINEIQFRSQFNSWASYKQFVMGDEISGANDKKIDKEILKKLITQKTLSVNKKFQQENEIRDTINYFLTSNQLNAFPLEENDRRFNVHEVTNAPREDTFYEKYRLWLEKEKGAEKVFYYLLHRDVSEFKPYSKALYNKAKLNMTIASYTDIAVFIRDLKRNEFDVDPNSPKPSDDVTLSEMMLSLGNDERYTCDFASSKFIAEMFNKSTTRQVSANQVSREMRNADYKQTYNGDPLPDCEKKSKRFFIIRNTEKWIKAGRTEIVEHITKEKGR